MGFFVSLDGEPSISTLALQSFKEPESRLASFESCRPPEVRAVRFRLSKEPFSIGHRE
jgi:hypothetical protein